MPGSALPPAEPTDERRPKRRPTRAPEPDPPPGFAGPDDGGSLTSLERELLAVLREGQASLIGELKAIRGDVRLGGVFGGVLLIVLVFALAMLRGLDPRALGSGASQVLRAVPGSSLILPDPAASSAPPAPLDSGGGAAAVEDSPAP